MIGGIVILPSRNVAAYPQYFRLPFEGQVRITSGPTPNESEYHRGSSAEAMDFQALDRKPFPIYAVADGKAYFIPAAEANGFGDTIMIEHYNGLWSIYAHLSKVLVGEGQKVPQGYLLGFTGNSGNGAGFHLHFEIRSGVPFRNSKPYPFGGTSIKIVDHPNIDYRPNQPCCDRGSAVGEPVSSQITQSSECSQTIAIVNSNSANLRSGPGTNYTVVATARKEERFSVVAQSGNGTNVWYLLMQASGKTAWISSGIVDLCPNNALVDDIRTASGKTIIGEWILTWDQQTIWCPERPFRSRDGTTILKATVSYGKTGRVTLLIDGSGVLQGIGSLLTQYTSYHRLPLVYRDLNTYVAEQRTPAFDGGTTITVRTLRVLSPNSIEGIITWEQFNSPRFPRCYHTNSFRMERATPFPELGGLH